MSFACHQDEGDGFFNCNSQFIPFQEICPLEDNVPEAIKIEKKKNNGINYLPGERLLIKLNKEKRKKKNNGRKANNLDVERITSSLGRMLWD